MRVCAHAYAGMRMSICVCVYVYLQYHALHLEDLEGPSELQELCLSQETPLSLSAQILWHGAEAPVTCLSPG